MTRYSIHMDPKEVDLIDKAAKKAETTRSKLIRKAALKEAKRILK